MNVVEQNMFHLGLICLGFETFGKIQGWQYLAAKCSSINHSTREEETEEQRESEAARI